MTKQRNLKARVREGMELAGERYVTARSHLVDSPPVGASSGAAIIDHGWALSGGTDPDASALAKILAHRGIGSDTGPLSEAMIFGISGGLGAGYILWEFAEHDSPDITLGFNNSWNYLDRRLTAALDRLEIAHQWTRLGARASSIRLRNDLADDNPTIVWLDRFQAGYWNLPARVDGQVATPPWPTRAREVGCISTTAPSRR